MKAVVPKPRVVLIDWKQDAAAPLVESLQASGFAAELSTPKGPTDLRALAAAPPAAFVITLERMPSHGREVALWLRRTKATRSVPLVFAGGIVEKLEAVRKLLPDATFADIAVVPAALKHALAATPVAPPLVPPPMASYAARSLATKLGIRTGSTVLLINAPPRIERVMEPLPEGAVITERARAADRVLLFVDSLAALAECFGDALKRVKTGGGLWIMWPKKSSGVKTDLNGNGVREFTLPSGWVDYKICSVDETWSGMLFAKRRK